MSERYVIRATTGYAEVGRTKPTTEWMVLDRLNMYRMAFTTAPRYQPEVRQVAEEVCDWLNAGGTPAAKTTWDPRTEQSHRKSK